MTKTLAAIAVTVGLLAGGAQAATVEQTLSFTDVVEPASLTFLPFDTTLGTFRNASISIRGTASIARGSVTGVTANRTVNNPADNTVTTTNSLVVFLDPSIIYRGIFEGQTLPTGATAACETPSAGESCTAFYATANRTFNRVIGTSDPSDFIGTGPVFEIGAFTSLQSGVENTSLETITGGPTTVWTVTGRATLTYTFDPFPEPDVSVVPLPGSLQLALGGIALLGGLGYVRRSRH